jgi:CRP-like cAMP-binding protein
LPEGIQTLDHVRLLEPLDGARRQGLARQCRWRRYAPHEQIIDRNDESREAMFIADGRVRIVNFSLSGREISFDELGPGAYFGELAAIDGEPRSASVVAVTDCLVAAMPSPVFLATVTEDPRIALAVMRQLARTLRRATERIMDLSTLAANNRVQAEILRLAKEGLRPDNSALIAPIPVHADIASRVSTTRETVARVFGDLARGGLVERHAGHLLVRDFDQLEQIVQDVRGDV